MSQPDPDPNPDETRIPLDTWTPPSPPDDGSPLEPQLSREERDQTALDTGLV